MKLVDILARELKVWPEGVDSVWQSSCDNEIYFDADVRPFYTSLNAEDSGARGAVITQAQWQAAVDALNAPKVVEWDEVGLPPIGMASCEYLGAHKYDEWTVVNIFAHYGNTVFVDFGDGWRAEKDSSRFRPIKTAEQLAEEEKKKVIDDMQRIYEESMLDYSSRLGHASRPAIKALYEAGYRKQ